MKMTQAIRARIAHMKALYELSGGVEHDGEMGAFREFFLAELLRPVLPHQFGVGSGVVVEKYGRQSPQLDVIIYDRRGVPPLLVAGDRGVYPLDSVLAVCEVKSTLKASDYEQAGFAARHFNSAHSECLAFARGGPNGSTPVPPLYAIFGYTADAKDKSEPARLVEQCPDPRDHDTIRLIAVLDKGLWLWDGTQYHQEPHPERVGEMFVLHLLNRLEDAANSRSPFRLQDWIT
jgi:hypothetical protein